MGVQAAKAKNERHRTVRTVLAVDPDPNRLAATSRAIGEDYPVLAATSGADALRVATSTKPDLIVLTISGPDKMLGRHVLAQLKRDDATRHIPVIVLSGTHRAAGLSLRRMPSPRYLMHPVQACLEVSVSCDRLMDEVREAIGPWDGGASAWLGHPATRPAASSPAVWSRAAHGREARMRPGLRAGAVMGSCH